MSDSDDDSDYAPVDGKSCRTIFGICLTYDVVDDAQKEDNSLVVTDTIKIFFITGKTFTRSMENYIRRYLPPKGEK